MVVTLEAANDGSRIYNDTGKLFAWVSEEVYVRCGISQCGTVEGLPHLGIAIEEINEIGRVRRTPSQAKVVDRLVERDGVNRGGVETQKVATATRTRAIAVEFRSSSVVSGVTRGVGGIRTTADVERDRARDISHRARATGGHRDRIGKGGNTQAGQRRKNKKSSH
jgi:hypothetical protein